MSADLAEKVVEEWLLEFADDINARAAVYRTSQKKQRHSATEARGIAQRLAKAEERLTQLTLNLADGVISRAAYRAAAEQVEREQAQLTARAEQLATNPVEVEAPQALPDDLAELWPQMSIAQRQRIVRPLVARVTINPAKRQGRGVWRERVEVTPRWEA